MKQLCLLFLLFFIVSIQASASNGYDLFDGGNQEIFLSAQLDENGEYFNPVIIKHNGFWKVFEDGKEWKLTSLSELDWQSNGYSHFASANERLLFGDFDGDSNLDVLILAEIYYSDTFLLTQLSKGGKLQVLKGYEHDLDLSVGNSNLELKDINKDGKIDLFDGKSIVYGSDVGLNLTTPGASPPFLDSFPESTERASKNTPLAVENDTLLAEPSAFLALPSSPNLHPGNAVGETKHIISVGNDGALNIAVPISLPTAPANMSPHINLAYSSNYSPNGMGIMSVGWSLQATKVIHRCSKNYSQDGKSHELPIQFNQGDRLCLNGQRLYLNAQNKKVSDTDYWTAGNQYHTELDGFLTITAGGVNPDYGTFSNFTMQDKTGNIYRFNHAEVTRGTKKQGRRTSVQGWKLTQIENIHKKRILYHYDDSDVHEQLLDRIEYLGDNTGNYKAIVKFHYKDAVDKRIHYRSNSITFAKNTKLLDKIDITLDGENYRTYQMGYTVSAHNGHSAFLTSIQESVKKQILKPLTFEWNDNLKIEQGSFSLVKQLDFPRIRVGSQYLTDVTGDGIKDLLHITHGNQLNFKNKVTGSSEKITSLYGGSSRLPVGEQVKIFDYTGDGIDDIVYLGKDQHYFAISMVGGEIAQLSTPFSFGQPGDSSNADFIDLNGDGKIEVMVGDQVYYNGLVTPPEHVLPHPMKFPTFPRVHPDPQVCSNAIVTIERYIGDVNGDGLIDALIKEYHRCNPNKYTSQTFYHVAYSNEDPNKTVITVASDNMVFTPKTIDLNGDGLADVYKQKKLNVTKERLFVRISKGENVLHGVNNWFDTGLTNAQFIGDINGDGFSDIATLSNSAIVTVYLTHYKMKSDGIGYSLNFEPVFNHKAHEIIGVTDLNRNGKQEFVFVDNTTIKVFEINSDSFSRTINSVTSQNKMTTINYATIGDSKITPNFLHENKILGFPLRRVDKGKLVESLNYPTPDGSRYKISYKYFDGINDQGGRGFLGFRKIESKNNRSNEKVVKHFKLAFPFTGSLTAQQHYVDEKLIYNFTNTIEQRTSVQGGIFVYSSTSIEDKYNLASNGSTSLLSKSKTTKQWDDWGNTTQVTLSISGDGNTYSTTTQTDFSGENNSSSRFGRASYQSKKYERTGELDIINTQNFHYKSNGVLEKSILQQGDKNQLVRQFIYDEFGNVTSESLTGRQDLTGKQQARTTHWNYVNNGRFLASNTNALGQTERYEYNQSSPQSAIGPVTQITRFDINKLRTETLFDNFGRQIHKIDIDRVITNTTRQYCSGCQGIPFASHSVRIDTQGQPTKASYYDHFGNLVGTEIESFEGGVILKQKRYDWKGRLVSSSQPSKNSISQYNTLTKYDALDRPILITEQTIGKNRETRWTYLGYSDQVIESGSRHTKTKNALGEPVVSEDPYGLTVNFTYNAKGQLRHTRLGNNQKTDIRYTHDELGNKTSTVSPGKGAEYYAYNAFGEMVYSKNARNLVTTYAYDLLGRRSFIRNTDGTDCWQYDLGANGKGKLYRSYRMPVDSYCGDYTKASYGKTFAYNLLGQQRQTDIKIEQKNYKIEQGYDDFSRINKLVLPATTLSEGNLEVNYQYNPRGYLRSVTQGRTGKLLQEVLAMDARGNITEEVFGNGISLNRGVREDTGETISLNAGNLLTAKYSYEHTANMKSRNIQFGFGVNARRYDQLFTYDDLDRLKTVTDEQTKQLINSFMYDQYGNITPSTLPVKPATLSCEAGYSMEGSICYKMVIPIVDAVSFCDEKNGWQQNGNQCIFTSYDYKQADPYCEALPNSHLEFGPVSQVNGKCQAEVVRTGNCGHSCGHYNYPLSYQCPTNYQVVGNNCQKSSTVSKPMSFGCQVGYQENDLGRCEALTFQLDKTQIDTAIYACEQGYTLSGNTCFDQTAQRLTPTNTVPTKWCHTLGYKLVGNQCKKQIFEVADFNYSCPIGYSRTGSYCKKVTSTKYANAAKSCPVNPYVKGVVDRGGYLGPAKIENGVCKYGVYAVGNCPGNCGTHTESINYTCPSGYKSTSNPARCIKQSVHTVAVVKSCPAGYQLNSNRSSCFKEVLSHTQTEPAKASCPTPLVLKDHACYSAQSVNNEANYSYDNTDPYRLDKHKGKKLNYDGSGNIKNYLDYNFSYTSFDKVQRITHQGDANDWTEYFYGPEGNRYLKQEHRFSQGKTELLTTEFIHSFYERHRRQGGAGNLVEEKYFIGDIVMTNRSNNAHSIYYTIKDHQGSTLLVTDETGNEANSFYYKPFGTQTDVSLSPLSLHTLRPTQYGYTGHEQIKGLDIINMGGRIYASDLKRFLQADPLVGHPMYSQSYNSYQYVYNNPLVNIDPSGYMALGGAIGGTGGVAATAVGLETNSSTFQSEHQENFAKGLQDAVNKASEVAEQGTMFFGIKAIYRSYKAIADLIGSTTVTPSTEGDIASSSPANEVQNLIKTPGGSEIQESVLGSDTANNKLGFKSGSLYTNDGGLSDAERIGANLALSVSEGDVTKSVKPGEFNTVDWKGYPDGVPKPSGPVRLLEGDEYNAARKAANAANQKIRRQNNLTGQPVDVHEVKPVKFDGSPTDPANKVILDRSLHRQQVTPWWNQLQKDVGG